MKNKSEIQDEALKLVLPLHRCGVGMSMGSGKTLLGLRHMNTNYSEYARFLVVAPKVSIFNEWKSQAVEHGLPHLVDHMEFTTYLSLQKKEYDYDVVYLDECHSLLESHESWLSQYQGKILGLTGTPPKYKGSEKAKMVDKYCPIVYKYVTDSAVKDKILNDYRIIIHTLRLNPLKTMPMTTKTGKQWFASELDTYNYWCGRLDVAGTKKEEQIMRVMRMKALMGFPSKEKLADVLLNKITDKVILFANTQDQADKFGIASYHSNNPKSEENLQAFKEGTIKKLAGVLQLNEGVNIPNLKQGIIMHAYGNERKASQRIGRLLRLNPKETSTIHILCYKDTVDESWVKQALEGYNQSKISTIHETI
jgi:superfamily II DNA or RNA helicase